VSRWKTKGENLTRRSSLWKRTVAQSRSTAREGMLVTTMAAAAVARRSHSLWRKSHALLVVHVPGRRGRSGRRSGGLERGREGRSNKKGLVSTTRDNKNLCSPWYLFMHPKPFDPSRFAHYTVADLRRTHTYSTRDKSIVSRRRIKRVC
jgi:hypothetical protein